MTHAYHDSVVMSTFIPWYDVGGIMTGGECRAGNAYPSRALDSTSGFHRSSFCPVICVLSHFFMKLLSFGFWVLIVLFFIAWYLYFLLWKDNLLIKNLNMCTSIAVWNMVRHRYHCFQTS